MAAQMRRRVRAAPIVERSEQEPPEAKRRPATKSHGTTSASRTSHGQRNDLNPGGIMRRNVRNVTMVGLAALVLGGVAVAASGAFDSSTPSDAVATADGRASADIAAVP